MLSERYSRQILFKRIGESGQKYLCNSRVLIIGAGALGTSSAEMLVRAGVGHVTIVDRDYVEWSNLQRQQLYTETDAENALPKAEVAAQRLAKVNSEVRIEAHVRDFLDFASEQSIDPYHLMIDATDNFATRLYMNDLAQKHRIPWIYGGATGSVGMTYTIVPSVTPCLSCMLKTIPSNDETCDTVGIIAPAIQWVTAHQVTEAMKILTGNLQDLRKTLLFNDMWTNQQTAIKMGAIKRANCPSCGTKPTYPYIEKKRDTRTTILCGRDTIQVRTADDVQINRTEVKERLTQAARKISVNDFLIHAHLDGDRRIVLFQDGRVLLHGMTNITEAHATYDRYIVTER